MSIENARLLIRVASQIKDESDKKALLELADEILANRENAVGISNPMQIEFPIPIFRRYKGKLYEGSLLKGWKIKFNGKTYDSPSAAAVFISGHPENGWRMWRYIDESSSAEQPIDRLRRIN